MGRADGQWVKIRVRVALSEPGRSSLCTRGAPVRSHDAETFMFLFICASQPGVHPFFAKEPSFRRARPSAGEYTASHVHPFPTLVIIHDQGRVALINHAPEDVRAVTSANLYLIQESDSSRLVQSSGSFWLRAETTSPQHTEQLREV